MSKDRNKPRREKRKTKADGDKLKQRKAKNRERRVAWIKKVLTIPEERS